MLKRFINNKRGVELVVIIYVCLTFFVLFLTLAICLTRTNDNMKKIFAISAIEETYTIDNIIKYGIERSFEPAIIKGYYDFSYNEKWIDESCKDGINGYKKLCAIDSQLDGKISEDIKKEFLKNLNLIKDSEEIATDSFNHLANENNVKDTEVKLNENSLALLTRVFFRKYHILTPYDWGKIVLLNIFKGKDYYDYVWTLNYTLSTNKSFSDVGLDGFSFIHRVIGDCVKLQNDKIENCTKENIKNFDVSIEVKDNKVFFDLESKKTFEQVTCEGCNNKIKMKFYVDKTSLAG